VMTIFARVRRSVWMLPLAALAAVFVFFINELAYRHSFEALGGLEQRATARTTIQNLLRRVIDAESAQRGYLLTGRAEYRQPYEGATAEVDQALAWLTAYYREDAPLKAALTELTARTREKMSDISTTIRLFDEGRTDAWQAILLTDIGREKMESIRHASERLLQVETDRVAHDREGLFFTLRLSRIGVNAMTAFSLLALALFLRQTAAFDAVQQEHAAALQSERDHLETEVARRTADLTELAGHLQTTREDERARLARELHDELGALLTAAKLDAARLKRSLGTISPEAEARLQHLNDTINHGIGLKRRIIEDLRPSSLSNLGLVSALEIQAREFAQRLEVDVRPEFEHVTLDDSAQITIYRLVQEALTNIAKYAGAKSVRIEMRRDGERAYVKVQDDGKGFEPQATRGSAHGLMGMRYRVEAEGGTMSVTSAPGQGTRIEAWLPALPEPAEV
jgi:signal transduction histidine kinase